RPAAALVFGARACRLEPDNAETWSNQGAFLKARQRYDEALACQQRALTIAPDNPTALSNLSNLLGKLERWDEALPPAERALQLAPQGADFHYNAGIVLKELAQFDRALQHFAEAQRLAGGHVKAQLHEALVQLLRGDFARGWPAYESRWLQPDCKEKHSFACPLWQGEELAGKTILLYSEQGLGDSFQFMRYAPLVAERAGRTLLVVQKEVEALARRMPGKHEVFASGATLPDFDLHCPLLSLPLAFGTTVDTVPANIPYLRCDDQGLAHWHQRLATLPPGRLKVGLVWAGRPTHGNDHNRSLRLSHFAPLLADPHFAWVALQKGPAVTEAEAFAENLILLDAELRDFDDTAAALSQLDVLVTVDTSVAHLAGALGIPTLVLLPRLPDWRWMWQRSDSPWYPGVTLLRQNQRGDWSSVMDRLYETLLARAGKPAEAPAGARRTTASKKKKGK
ncbi:MAG TPA: tetratricopeptide repeat protein, partial [Rhodocyclaceae bacterium]|nr:tetratricopeptide repeat protein [Rhodocyclaceae bacterium]